MPPERKSARFEPTVPLPPQTILSLETELSYFRRRHPLLLETDLRSFGRGGYPHPYLYPAGRRGGTPERDCLDWTQYPLTPAVAAAIRTLTATAGSRAPSPNPVSTRARSRQPTPAPQPGLSRQPTPARQVTPARQPTPGPSTSLSAPDSPPPPQTPSRKRRSRSVRFPSDAPEGRDDEPEEEEVATVALPDADGLISKPDGEVGRHHRGYPLKAVLGWPEKKIKSLREVVNSYVGNYLNISLSASNQPKSYVADLTKLIQADNPGAVDGYRDGWPIRDMIHLRLKYTSSRHSSNQQVPQGEDYPKDLKKALKEAHEREKRKQRATE
ncbi:hypothetical protein LXA43DRAFT_1103100 [Ganoderma leucocontextum]|nr:hypothetical protein LXA43DRAFT_1103100 [Ganoderma leucocontextum]